MPSSSKRSLANRGKICLYCHFLQKEHLKNCLGLCHPPWLEGHTRFSFWEAICIRIWKKKYANYIKMPAKALMIKAPELGEDVDKLDDLVLARAILEK